MRWRIGFVVAVLALGLGAAAPARAQSTQDALKQVPADALGFAVLNNLKATNAKVVAFAKRVKAPLPFSPLEKAGQELGIGNSVALDGTVLFAAVPGEENNPLNAAPLLYLPVKDYKAFLEGVGGKGGDGVEEITLKNGKAMLVGKAGPFAVLTEPKFGNALKRTLKGGKAGAALAPLQTWLAEVDAAGVLTPSGVKLLSAAARKGLEQAKEKTGDLPPEAQFVGDWLKGLDQIVGQVSTEVTHLAIGLRADQTGNVDLSIRAVFAKGSDLAKAGAKAKAVAQPLAGLPDGPFALALGGAFSEQAMSALTGFGMKALKSVYKDVPPEQLKKIEDLSRASVKGLHGMAFALGVGTGKEPLFHNMYAVVRVEDAETYLANAEKSAAAMSALYKDLKISGAGPTSYSAKRTKIEGKPALVVTAAMGGGDDVPEIQKKMMEMYFGPGGKMVTTTVIIDKNTLLMRYAPPATMKAVLKAYQQDRAGLAKSKQIKTTAALLPQGAQWVAYVSPKGLVDLGLRIANSVVPEGTIPPLPEFPAAAPIGFGVKLDASGLDLRLVVPADSLEAIGGYIERIRQLKGNASIDESR